MVVAEGTQGGGHDLGAGRLLGVGGHGLDLAQRPPGPAADRLARRSQADGCAAARAVEQRLVKRRFQGRYLVRQRGLGVAERAGGPPERPEFGDREDRLQLAEPETVFDRLNRSQLRYSFTLAELSLISN